MNFEIEITGHGSRTFCVEATSEADALRFSEAFFKAGEIARPEMKEFSFEVKCSHEFVDSKRCVKCGWQPTGIVAVYCRRSDGDFDFVAAFASAHLAECPSNWPQQIADWLNRSKEQALIVNGLSLPHVPAVWGHVESGEICVIGILRELREETGLSVDGNRLQHLFHNVPAVGYTGKSYQACGFLLELNHNEELRCTEPHKHTEWKWVFVSDLEGARMIPSALRCLGFATRNFGHLLR